MAGRKKTRFRITLSAAEWSALCICANHGATEMVRTAATPGHRDMADNLAVYCDQAVKIIHAALPIPDGAPATAPAQAADASGDTPGETPPAESPAPLGVGPGTED